MLKPHKESVRRFTRRVWGVFFTLVIAFAVILQLGKEAFPLLNEYAEPLSQMLGDQLGVEIRIGEVQAVWKGLQPQLDLYDVLVESREGEKIFEIVKARAEINLLESLFRGQIYWQRIDLEKLQTEAVQNSDGHWQIKALNTTSAGSGLVIDDPLDVFLFGRRIEIKDLSIELSFRTGHKTQLYVPLVNLENDRDFHRIVAALEVDDDAQAFSFIVEGYGDPRDKEKFTAKAFLELQNFPMEKVLAAIGTDVWDKEINQQWRDGHRLDMQVWIEGSPSLGLKAYGNIRADGLPIHLPQEISLPSAVHSDLFAVWHNTEGWMVNLPNLNIFWQEISAPVVNIKLHGENERDIKLSLDSLILHDWLEKLKEVGLEKNKVGNIVSQLSPVGVARNITIDFTSAEAGYFTLQAELEGAGVSSFKGSPRFKNVNAYVETSALAGQISFDNSLPMEMYFPKVYEKPFLLSRSKGKVSWQADKNSKKVFVASSVLEAAYKQDNVVGQFSLELPISADYGEEHMTLILGLDSTSTRNYKDYLPAILPKNLNDWLRRSIGDAQLDGLEFLYDGGLRKKSALPKSVQLVTEVHNGNIAFDEEWPILREVEAMVYLDNQQLNVEVSDASLLGNRVNLANISMVEDAQDKSLGLLIKGQLNGNAKAAMALLQNSPVRHSIGKTFDSWLVNGDVNAQIELLVPLTSAQENIKQTVSVNFSNAGLNIPDLQLGIEKINGDLHYSSSQGLYSDRLGGTIWGEKFVATVASPLNTLREKETEITFTGRLKVEDLYHWTSRPELRFMEGRTEIVGSLRIPASQSEGEVLNIDIHSNLEGVQVNLPPPMTKPGDEQVSFNTNIDIFDDRQEFRFVYDNWARLNIVQGAAERNSAQLVFGDDDTLPEAGFFDVVGDIETFDLLAWNVAREKYFEFVQQTEQAEEEVNSLPIRLEVLVGNCSVAGVSVSDLRVSGFGTEQDWTLFFNSDFIKGRVITYESDRPIFMDLDYLRFPGETRSSANGSVDQGDRSPAEKSLLAGFDLSGILPIDFSTREVSLAEENYGEWSFQLSPIENGIELMDIEANTRGIQVGGGEESARFVWTQKNGENTSYFQGNLAASNIADVTAAWNIDKVMESASVEVNATANWLGAPDEFSLIDIEGLVLLDIRDGNFIRGAEVGENPLLRLLALFNFDTLARRLRLDFSDLAKQGFAFDRVSGELRFKSGNIYLDSPLIVESTSSSMQMVGSVDMIGEQIDSELIVTLPLASNLALFTALTAGLPAGVGVYLVSKLFKKQVDRASSISYSLSGQWDEPKLRVRRVLNNAKKSKKRKTSRDSKS